MTGPHARVTTRVAAEEATAALLATGGAERWVTVSETVEELPSVGWRSGGLASTTRTCARGNRSGAVVAAFANPSG